MSDDAPTIGRRERNKQDKLDRIMAAASILFDRHGVDDVTTARVAAEAGIGAGTLFLYAKNKGELLLLVQTERYAAALEQGRVAAQDTDGVLEGLMAIVRPVVETNRYRIDNGRSYLREMLFGDSREPHHARALQVVTEMEEALADVVGRSGRLEDPIGAAQCISAVMFIALAGDENVTSSTEEIIAQIARQIAAVLPQ